MGPLDFTALRAANVARQQEVWPAETAWGPTDWATAMGGECGEALNVVKKMRRLRGGFGRPETPEGLRQALASELADLICYADLLAQCCGIDLGEAVRAKFNLVSSLVSSSIKL